MRFISFLIAFISFFALSSAAPIFYDDNLGYGEVSSQLTGLSRWSSPAPASTRHILVGRSKTGDPSKFSKIFHRIWDFVKGLFKGLKPAGGSAPAGSSAMSRGSNKVPEAVVYYFGTPIKAAI